MDEGINRLRTPSLVVPVSGRAGLEAAVKNGADAVVLNGRMGYDANAVRLDANLGVVRAAQLADGIEHCLARSVGVRLALPGSFPVRRFNDILDLAAELAEAGVSAIELSDHGLAAAFKVELPDLLLIYNGVPVCNVAACRAVSGAGFDGIALESSISCTEINSLCSGCDLVAEVPVFGLRSVAWCRSCMLGEYFESSKCRGSVTGPCRRVFTAEGGRSGGKLLDNGFFGGLMALPDIIKAGAGSVRLDVARRQSSVVAGTVSVFREALDLATHTMVEKGIDGLNVSMYPEHAFYYWTGRLISAAMHGDVVPTGGGWTTEVSPVMRGGTVRCSVMSRLVRFVEPVAIEMENRAFGRLAGGISRVGPGSGVK